VIYFITQQDKYVKIGYTAGDPNDRVESLQVGNPHELILYGAVDGDIAYERVLQGKFHKSHVRGEWYELTPDIIEYLSNITDIKEGVLMTMTYMRAQHSLLDKLREDYYKRKAVEQSDDTPLKLVK